MDRLWLNLAAATTFIGSVFIAYAALAAFLAALRDSIPHARGILAGGVIHAMEFVLAGTLLKALLLMQWEQIGMLAAIYTLRLVLKHIFLMEKITPPGNGINTS